MTENKITIFISRNSEQSLGWQVSDDARAFTGPYVGLMMIYKYEDVAYCVFAQVRWAENETTV